MIEQNSDKNSALAFLSTFSIQEITNIFGEIDDKILSLHSCSSEDFLTLNSYFKKYYADSKVISSNATNLFNLVTDEGKRKFFINQLNDFSHNLQDLLVNYESFVNSIISSVEQMIQEMDKMFVTANNLKQDIMTLKLLVTNLKLDVIVSISRDDNIAQKANDFNELIVQTKSFFIEFYKHSNLFKDSLKILNMELILQRSKNVQNINDTINEFKLTTILLDRQFNEALQLVPRLSESTTNTSTSIDKIITNLQYQDIIRQKIDHIQQTHRDILKKINDIKESDNEETNLENKLKWFIQIRDIAGLQAAQLIHANKEYQKAIEIISEKFLEVGNNMTSISELCMNLAGNQNGSSVTYIEEVKIKVERTAYISESFESSMSFISDKTIVQENQLKNVVDNYEELSDFIFTIEKSIIKSLNHNKSSEIEQYQATSHQIRSILEEIRNINTQYQNQFSKIKEISFSNISSEIDPIVKFNSKLKQFKTNSDQLVFNLVENNENIFKIIVENQVLSGKISSDIKTSLEQIKYYDYFDKVIEEIIFKLNDINKRLHYIDEAENNNHSLDYLKQRYTMQSEHLIHDSMSNENEVGKFDFNSTGTEEDDDNLELF